MRIFALYLPQFHEIPENNRWWGEGFTEWTNCKKAVPLYKNHRQPNLPLNNNFYNLLDKKTVEWQTELMKTYNIDAFVYYHYYFKGVKILEKPAENLLKWKDLDQKFFFNWANHDWAKTWNGSKELLLKQEYGSINDWKEHFCYLLPFFKDERYVKINNMPLLIIYDGHFKEKNEMFNWFDLWCKEEGFSGLYLIEECFDINDRGFFSNISDSCKNIYYTQPLVGKNKCIKGNIFSYAFEAFFSKVKRRGIVRAIRKYNGDNILRKSMIPMIRQKGIPGLFFEWDNTPRHGDNGFVINSISHKTFLKYMEYYKKSDFMIVNAWNEWCEGMILEPSCFNGFKYLEWIRDWKNSGKDKE